jgi:hypothetical protein
VEPFDYIKNPSKTQVFISNVPLHRSTTFFGRKKGGAKKLATREEFT